MAADLPSWQARLWSGLVVAPLVVLAAIAGGAVAAGLIAVLAVQFLVVSPLVPRAGVAIRRTVHVLAAAAGRGIGSLARFGRTLAVVLWRVVPAGVGTLTLLIVADLAAGRAWDRFTTDDVASHAAPSVAPLELVDQALPPAVDPRVDSPAMAGAPWAERYFQEFAAIPYTYLPFVGPRDGAVRGRYINTGDGIRRSYEPAGAKDDRALTVWFFGGSTLWGEGQRDRHTIPSQVARLAEADGVALRVVNYGIRGYTAFQEFLVFEQELGRRPPPDLAVFYHGANEFYSLLESPGNLGPQPTMFQLGVLRRAFDRAPALPGEEPPAEPSVARAYGETGVVSRLWRSLRRTVEQPAGAQSGPTPGAQRSDERRALTEAAQIYRRSVALIRHTAVDHDVPTEVFWQPGGLGWNGPPGDHPHQVLGDRLGNLHIDIADALDEAPPSIYLDGLHTNEQGARLSAVAIWEHLAPAVEAVRR